MGRIDSFFMNRFGMDRKSWAAALGAIVAAPVAVITTPLLGVGAGMAMVAPHMSRCWKARKQFDAQQRYKQELIARGEVLTPEMVQQMLAQSNPAPEPGAAQPKPDENERKARDELKQLHGTVEQLEQEIARLTEDNSTLQELALVGYEALQQRMKEEAEPAKPRKKNINRKRSPRKSSAKSRGPELKARECSREQLLAPLSIEGGMNEEQYLQRRARARAEGPKAAWVPLDAHWAEHLMGGTSGGYEFRRSVKAELEPGSRNFIYCKSPVGRVLGYADIEEVISGTPEEVWEAIKDRDGFGYSEEDFWGHYAGAKKAQLLRYGNIQRFPNPPHYKEIGLMPQDMQGVRYMSDETEGFKRLMDGADQMDFRIASSHKDGEYVPGHGSKADAELAAIAQKTKETYERKIGRSCSALSPDAVGKRDQGAPKQSRRAPAAAAA